MFGPVTSNDLAGSLLVHKMVLFGTNLFLNCFFLVFYIFTPGCVMFINSRNGRFTSLFSPFTSGIIIGQQIVSPSCIEAIASD